MKGWVKQLNPASFRGLRFGVLGGEARFGRRLAVHEYPGRDKPYAEDMGRGLRVVNLVGFLISDSLVYDGGDVIEQRDLMIGAAEKAGPGILIHPTLGQMLVSVPAGGLSVVERWDEGRYFELHFSFIESGDRVFPATKPDHRSFLELVLSALGLDAAADFVASVQANVSAVFKAIKTAEGYISDALDMVESVIDAGQSAVNAVVDTVAGFQQIVGRISRDASQLSSLTSLLSGDFGRYKAGATTSALQQSRKGHDSSAELAGIIAASVAQRAAVATASTALATAAAGFGAGSLATFTQAAQALVATVAAGIAAPADQIRLLSQLASFTTTDYASTSQIGQAKTVAQYVTAALLRRAAIGQLAKAANAYVPTSYDDAISVRNTVVGFIEAEMLIAGDMGDDATYGSLRDLRQAVVQDLDARGASLAPLEVFTLRDSLPSLVLANRLYQDATRSDELIGVADPIHPAFMPSSFRALSS